MNNVPPTVSRLGFWMTLALVMGTMIGSGVFLLPASLAPYGWNALYGWLITITGALCIAYSIAALARAMPASGGILGSIGVAFGPLPAFLVGWSYILSTCVACAAVSIAAVSYLSMFQPSIVAGEGAPAMLALGLVWLVTIVNLVSVRSGGGFQIVTMTLKVLPLIAVAVIGLGLVSTGTPTATPYVAADISLDGIAATAALTLWAMLGFECASLAFNKVDNAASVVPRATLVGALVVGAIYVSVSLFIVAYLPVEAVASSPAPFADFIAAYWGRGPAAFVALFAAISAIGALNGIILLQGEMARALAAKGQLPLWLAVTDGRGTPRRALIIGGLFVSLLSLANFSSTMVELFTFMILLSTSANLVLYFACTAAALWLMYRGAIETRPLFTLLACIGLVYSLWTFEGAGLEASSWTLVLVAAGLPVYMLSRYQKVVVPAE